jgi:hypothetical protein
MRGIRTLLAMVGFAVLLPGGALAEVPQAGANATLDLNGSNTYSDQTYTGSISLYHNTSTYGYTLAAESVGEFGFLRSSAFASMGIDERGGFYYCDVLARSAFVDSFLESSRPAGTPGRIEFTMTVDASLNKSDPVKAGSTATIRIGKDFLLPHSVLPGLQTIKSGQFSFLFGVPLFVSFELWAEASANPQENISNGDTQTADVHTEHGAVLTGIEVFEDNGTPIDGLVLTSGSGTVYPLTYPVPEPRSAALAALAALCVLARRAAA